MAKREYDGATLVSMSLLNRRIREYKIPPWPGQMCYGRIGVFQVPDKAAGRKTFMEGGLIEMTDEQESGRARRAPRGILVSAGLQAMDVLYGNGIGLGDMIWMASHTPWRFELDTKKIEGRVENIEFFFMQAGDAVLCEDLGEKLKRGEVKIVRGADGKHRYWYEDGTELPRFDPPEHPDDM